MSRLQPLYRGDLSAPAHGLRYQISPIDFALMNMYSDFPDVDLLAAWSLSSPQRVVAVSACCSSGKLNIYTNMVARLLFRRANGDVFSLGAAGSNECQRPQVGAGVGGWGAGRVCGMHTCSRAPAGVCPSTGWRSSTS